MDMLLQSTNGSETLISEADWENLVYLLDSAGVDLVSFVNSRSLDGEAAKQAGERLLTLPLECVETSQGTRVRAAGGQDTNPVLSITARIASGLGDDETATKAQQMLLREMATLVVRPLNEVERSKIDSWSEMLIHSGGVRMHR